MLDTIKDIVAIVVGILTAIKLYNDIKKNQ